MTKKDYEVYNYIKFYKSINGFSPSFQEIAKALYTSRAYVRTCVERLASEGYLKYDKLKHRSIIVLK